MGDLLVSYNLIMKNFTLFGILCFLFFDMKGQTLAPETVSIYLNSPQAIAQAKFRIMSAYIFNYKDGKLKDSALAWQNYYDTLGNIFDKRYSQKRFIYTYSKNKLLKVEEIDQKIKMKIYYDFTYDTSGRVIKESVYPASNDNHISYRYVYNNSNQLSAIFRSFKDGKEFLYRKYQFQGGRITRIDHFLEGKQITHSIDFEYKNDGLTKTKWLHVRKQKSKIADYFYTSDGKLVSATVHQFDFEPLGYTTINPDYANEFYKYNIHNLLDEVKFIRNGEVTRLMRFYYFSLENL